MDTKIAIIVRNDLLIWQKLNVTAFLTSGVIGAKAELLGETYADASGKTYRPLLVQPIIILSTDKDGLKKILNRADTREVETAIYIEDMFATGHDAANRATVMNYATEDLNLVGLALRDEKKVVDKITKGARMHP
ncbi:MAG: DUF2000 family protein [Pseudomonadota bacterium]